MLYYFDETADQGFVDKTTSLSEYGILAGIAFPERAQEALEKVVERALIQHLDCGYQKLHCTEIFKNDENQDLRQALYSTLKEFQEYLIVYEGQYSVGVKNFEESTENIIEQHKPDLPDHIKIQRSKERTRLYISLLTGIIVKLEECAISENEEQVHMISDCIDQKVQNEAKELLADLQSDTKNVIARSFNTETKTRSTRTYKIEMQGELATVSRVRDIAFLEEVTPISFAADFVCFELLRHFRRKMKIQQPIKFHSEESLEGFPLKHKVAFLGDNYFSDLVFNPTISG